MPTLGSRRGPFREASVLRDRGPAFFGGEGAELGDGGGFPDFEVRDIVRGGSSLQSSGPVGNAPVVEREVQRNKPVLECSASISREREDAKKSAAKERERREGVQRIRLTFGGGRAQT